MKKKFLTFVLSICFIIPCMFMLSACSINTPADIEFKVENGYVQYYDGNNWNNLIAVEDLKGEQGDPGTPGRPGNTGTPGTPGADADIWTIGNNGYWYKNGVKTNSKAVGTDGTGISQITKDHANSDESQTTYKIHFTDGSSYSFVVKNGIDGEDLITEEISVYFDLNIPTQLECIASNLTQYFTNYEVENDLYKKDLNKGDRISLIDFSQEEIFRDYFLGWYENVDDSESKFTSLTIVPETLTLTAKWDDKKIEKDFAASEGLVFNGNSVVYRYDGTDTN